MPGMSEETKKPVWPWFAVLLIGLPVLYVASFGPAVWLCKFEPDRFISGGPFFSAHPALMWVYCPMFWLWHNGPKPLQDVISAYITWWLS